MDRALRDLLTGPSGEPLLPELLAPGLDVIFIGAAPSVAAAASGHYYAGCRNRFWALLYQAGFTPRELRPEEDGTVLRYGIGLTAILPSHISTSNDLLPEPGDAARHYLLDRLVELAPHVVAYNGRDVYRMCHNEDATRWGCLGEKLGQSLQFVVHSSSGRADRWAADRLFLYRELHGIVAGSRVAGRIAPTTKLSR